MAKHTAQFTSLNRAILDYISQAQLTSAQYLRLWQLGIRGLEELGMDVTESPKTRKLTVSANNTVELPNDCVQWVKVGVLNAKGEVATLRRNEQLSTYALIEDARLSEDTGSIGDPLVGSYGYYRNFQQDGCYFNLFGVPGGTQNLGEFRVDDVQGIILLDNNYSFDHIILEYISSPLSDADYLFPIQVREALVSWLDWKNIQSLPQGRRSNLGMIEQKKREWLRQKRLSKIRLNPIRLFEMNDVIRISNRIGIKS